MQIYIVCILHYSFIVRVGIKTKAEARYVLPQQHLSVYAIIIIGLVAITIFARTANLKCKIQELSAVIFVLPCPHKNTDTCRSHILVHGN